MQPAEVQASRVKAYAVHGSKRRKRKWRDSPLNSRLPSLYKLYVWKGEEEEQRREESPEETKNVDGLRWDTVKTVCMYVNDFHIRKLKPVHKRLSFIVLYHIL